MKQGNPLRNPDIVGRKEEKEALLFDPSNGNMLCINTTGMSIWDLCDGGNSIDAIVSKIEEEYDIAAEQASEDSIKFLEVLEKKGFLGYRI